jgi:hypothetical protein
MIGQVAVRHVLEVDRHALALVEAIAKLEGNMQQDARAKRLAVRLNGIEVAVVDGRT